MSETSILATLPDGVKDLIINELTNYNSLPEDIKAAVIERAKEQVAAELRQDSAFKSKLETEKEKNQNYRNNLGV